MKYSSLVPKPRILFVCGRNQWRSPTAEEVYRRDPRLDVRSAGVSPSSRQRVTEKSLQWTSLVLAMERKHAARIREQFDYLNELPPIKSLDIPDEYQFMDAELIGLIRDRVEPILASLAEELDAGEDLIDR